MTALYIILALSAGIVLPALICAPEGWEDSAGFHYGREGE